MAAGTPEGRRHLAEPKEIAGPASRWSWARTTDGRAARGNEYHRLTVVRQGMRVVGVPVGTEQFQRDFLQEAVNGEPAELVRALVPMEGAQASFQIFAPICHFSPLTFTSNSPALHHVPSCSKLRRFGEWALASIIAGDGAAAAGLPTPEEVAHDPTVCQNHTYLGHDALRQAHLPIREGGLGLTSSSSIKGAAYIGCHALVLGRVVAAPPGGTFRPFLNGCLSDPWRQRSLKS